LKTKPPQNAHTESGSSSIEIPVRPLTRTDLLTYGAAFFLEEQRNEQYLNGVSERWRLTECIFVVQCPRVLADMNLAVGQNGQVLND
jgi:hypothetical protein